MFISFNFENVYDDDDVPPEGLKANSGRLEGEDVDQAVLELVHLKIVSSYFHHQYCQYQHHVHQAVLELVHLFVILLSSSTLSISPS